MDDVTISAAGVDATIQLQSGMVTARFDVGGRSVEPLYTAPWRGWRGVPLLEHLRGDFLCVPFGDAPASLEHCPPAWSRLDPGVSAHPHGWSSNGVWTLLSAGAGRGDEGATALLQLDYPEEDAVDWVRREVRCEAGRLAFTDTVHVRRGARLPLGLHPILALPDTPGAAHLNLPACQTFATLPFPPEPTSTLAVDARFADPTRAPRSDGGTRDLTRLPFADDTEEIVLVANPEEGRVSLDDTEGGYRVTLEWDHTVLRHLLVWMSNRGRPFAPWGGTNVCLGVEPVTAAFDLGESVSAADNPLDAEGIPTVVALSPESDLVIRHGIGVDLLP